MGPTKRRNFAPEYKAAAVERLNEPGAIYGSVSADLGRPRFGLVARTNGALAANFAGKAGKT